MQYVDCSRLRLEEPTPDQHVQPILAGAGGRLGRQCGAPLKAVDGSGSVTYDRTFSKITIGYPISAKASPLRPELPANGTSQGRSAKVLEQTLRMYASLGGKVTYDNKTKAIPAPGPGKYKYGDPFELYTGDKAVGDIRHRRIRRENSDKKRRAGTVQPAGGHDEIRALGGIIWHGVGKMTGGRFALAVVATGAAALTGGLAAGGAAAAWAAVGAATVGTGVVVGSEMIESAEEANEPKKTGVAASEARHIQQ